MASDKTDKNDYSIEELAKQISAMQAKLQEKVQAKRGTALEQARELVSTYDFSPTELGCKGAGAIPKQKRAGAQVKYRNPANARETWTGRGRMPKHISVLLEGGKTLQDLIDPAYVPKK